MNVLRFSDPGYEQKLEQLASHSSLFDSVIDERTRAIIEDVRTRGDEALLELTARFDRALDWRSAAGREACVAHGPFDVALAADVLYEQEDQAPLLDLQGEEDAVAPRRFSQVLKTMLGDRVSVVVIPHAGHAMAPEQPRAMADAIATFSRHVYGIDQ